MSELDGYLRLHFAGIKAAKLPAIEAHFGGLNAALLASLTDWKTSQIATERQLEKWFSDEFNRFQEHTLNWQVEENQTLLTLSDERFPKRLAELTDPPILLYVRGDVEWLNRPQIAIVGSRHASKMGCSTAMDFAHFLSEQGLTITSGLATGIDAAAHQGGLQGLGKTLAVVGTGLDRVYPASNRLLAHQIAQEGAMISEFALGLGPLRYHFPQRNRLISGLSLGTLLVEAALKSGSLITARTALEQGKEVFAVPGSIHDPKVKGCHHLIKQGAKLVETGADLLEEIAPLLSETKGDLLSLNANNANESTPNGLTTPQIKQTGLLQYFEQEPVSLDELVVWSKKPVSTLQSELLMLELEGELIALSGGRWQRP